MNFQHSVLIDASPADIYTLYADVVRWPIWDSEVQESSISGVFETGATGSLKPKGGPKSKIFFTDVKPNTSFTVQSKLPLCTMTFEHELVPNGLSTTATHRVLFTGLLSPVFGRLIGNGIRRTLPETMRGLKRAAESNCRLPKIETE
jgi:Polyketide cyclase / dehydrase and lipid transport